MYEGNRVRDQDNLYAICADIGGSSASLMSGSKMVDCISLLPGNDGEQSDAPAAYTQASLEGTPTWVTLPEEQWPAPKRRR